jgi:hypothetical protein
MAGVLEVAMNLFKNRDNIERAFPISRDLTAFGGLELRQRRECVCFGTKPSPRSEPSYHADL